MLYFVKADSDTDADLANLGLGGSYGKTFFTLAEQMGLKPWSPEDTLLAYQLDKDRATVWGLVETERVLEVGMVGAFDFRVNDDDHYMHAKVLQVLPEEGH